MIEKSLINDILDDVGSKKRSTDEHFNYLDEK